MCVQAPSASLAVPVMLLLSRSRPRTILARPLRLWGCCICAAGCTAAQAAVRWVAWAAELLLVGADWMIVDPVLRSRVQLSS